MTLVLAALSRSRGVVVGDRRLTTADGTVWREDRTKLTLLETVDSRVVVGFAGLGQVGTFRTDRWLLETLLEVAPPHYTLGSVLHGLREMAARRVNSLKQAGIPLTPDQRRLSFYVAGYAYPDGDATDARLAYGIISNFERVGEPTGPGSSTDFEITGAMEAAREGPDPPRVVLIGGNHSAVALADVSSLADLLEEGAPSGAVVGKAIDVIRETARRPEARGTIGEDILSAVLVPDPGTAAELSHHPLGLTSYFTSPNIAHLGGQDDSWLARDSRLAIDPPGAKMVPKMGRNDRCWCGSGLKYKRCHGA